MTDETKHYFSTLFPIAETVDIRKLGLVIFRLIFDIRKCSLPNKVGRKGMKVKAIFSSLGTVTETVDIRELEVVIFVCKQVYGSAGCQKKVA